MHPPRLHQRSHFKDGRLIAEIEEKEPWNTKRGSFVLSLKYDAGVMDVSTPADLPDLSLSVKMLRDQLDKQAIKYPGYEHDCQQEGCGKWFPELTQEELNKDYGNAQ